MPEPSTDKDKVIPVRVALRIRPLNPKEIGEGCQQCIDIVPGQPQVVIRNNKAFTYDYVFDHTSMQEQLYNQAVEPLLDGLFKGYNATVLAYGQTGSGKTYSMGTSFSLCSSEDETTQGVIPRVIKRIFTEIDSRKDQYEFMLKVSFLEIHNEEIHDLLNPGTPDDKIAIRETLDGGIKIAGLQELNVTSGVEMARCLEQGAASRITAATAMNTRSSRSHAIFTISMEQREKVAEGDVKKAKFHLVDLAGSERAKKTQAQGDRFKEGVNINRGLLALGNVISALGEENRKSGAHIPYRDSKLTRLLQDSLGGNSNTVMVACVSPADSNLEETLNTLRYADRARQIKNKPIVNRDPATAEIVKLRQQLQTLQMQLLQSQTINGSYGESDGHAVAANVDISGLTERIKQLEEENKKLGAELNDAVDQNTEMHEKVLVAEFAKDKMVRKFEELKTNFRNKIEVQDVESSLDDIDLAKELESKIKEFEDTLAAETRNYANDSTDLGRNVSTTGEPMTTDDTGLDATFVSQHALRQAELSRQLQELTKALAMKEELAKKMVDSDKGMNALRKQYENTVRELESELNKLEKEKADLSVALATVKSEPSANGKMRERIRELEKKIAELKKRQVEQEKLRRIQQQSDNTIKKLNTEIQNMKSVRVKLMKQVKEESERFRALKTEKNKEILQLKEKGRKRQFEFKKMETMHAKQQNVLKRKAEEAAAANKRLKEALYRQKEAADKRAAQQHHQNKQMDNVVPRMKSWLTHEVEVMVSVAQAKLTLQEMIEDRKVLSRQLSELKNLRQDTDEQPPMKKVAKLDGTPNRKDEIPPDLNNKIKGLEMQLKLRSSQVAELQQKLLEAEQGDKSKFRWKSVHTMAEAKAGLHVLLNMAVSARTSCLQRDKDREEKENSYDELQALLEEKNQMIETIKQKQMEEITSLQQEHEEKVLFLLQQVSQKNNTKNDASEESEVAQLKQRVHFQEAQIEELGSLHDEIQLLREENENLKQQLIKVTELFDSVTPTTTPTSTNEVINKKVPKKKTKRISEERVAMDEFWLESDEEEYNAAELERDPDWIQTPHVKRKNNRKTSRLSESDSEKQTQNGDTASKSLEKQMGCSCKGKCMRNCWCKDNNVNCSGDCACKVAKCVNRTRDPSTPVIITDSSADDSGLRDSNNGGSPLDLTFVMAAAERKPLAEVNNSATVIASKPADMRQKPVKDVENRRETFTLDVPPTKGPGVSCSSSEDEMSSKPPRSSSTVNSSTTHFRRKANSSARSFMMSSSVLRTSGSGLPSPKRTPYFPSPFKHKSLSNRNGKVKKDEDNRKRKLMKLSENNALLGLEK